MRSLVVVVDCVGLGSCLWVGLESGRGHGLGGARGRDRGHEG